MTWMLSNNTSKYEIVIRAVVIIIAARINTIHSVELITAARNKAQRRAFMNVMPCVRSRSVSPCTP